MNWIRLFILAILVTLVSCQSIKDKDTIAKLRHKQIEIKDEKIEGGLEKAILSYKRFLEETPDSALTPEAIRRLADLKIEKEYGTLTEDAGPSGRAQAQALPAPKRAALPKSAAVAGGPSDQELTHIPIHDESESDFEKRATQRQQVAGVAATADGLPEVADDLERVSTREAIELYKKAMRLHPHYPAWYPQMLGKAYTENQQYDLALAAFGDALARAPHQHWGHSGSAIVYVRLGKLEEARNHVDKALALNPELTLESYRASDRFHKDPEILERVLEDLRRAGLK